MSSEEHMPRIDYPCHPVSADPLFVVPAILDVMTSNYTLQRARFRTILCVGGDDGESAWDASDTIMMACILRLNRLGRRYVSHNAHDLETGWKLLAAVSDDWSCIFYHLREIS